MKAILTDGRTLDVGGIKAVDSGVVLFEDEEREHVVGFLPHQQLTYVLPDDVAEAWHAEGVHGRQPPQQQPQRQSAAGGEQQIPPNGPRTPQRGQQGQQTQQGYSQEWWP